jgi:hypothetical protein
VGRHSPHGYTVIPAQTGNQRFGFAQRLFPEQSRREKVLLLLPSPGWRGLYVKRDRNELLMKFKPF